MKKVQVFYYESQSSLIMENLLLHNQASELGINIDLCRTDDHKFIVFDDLDTPIEIHRTVEVFSEVN